jgi:hypothetical protein
MTARRVRDAEGDVWEETPDGWVDLTFYSYLPTLEVLEMVWGPLTEVDE